MPRKSRIDAAGALHHIILRGIEQRPVFRDDYDRERFLTRLEKLLIETRTPCYAWVLMSNHIHLLLATGAVPIATLMRRLLTGYAQDFNRRHNRHGHVFQNRYKSILCEQETYLLALVRYIHLNPLRAMLVHNLDELKRYPFSGHAVLMGRKRNTWQDTDFVLRHFGDKRREARKDYLEFVQAGVGMGRQPNLTGGGLLRSAGGWKEFNARRSHGERIKGDERILGDSAFVTQAIKAADESFAHRMQMKLGGVDPVALLSRVAAYYGMEPHDITTRTKQREISQARAVFCFLAVRRLEVGCAEIAKLLSVSPAAVSKAVVRGQAMLQGNTCEEEILKRQ